MTEIILHGLGGYSEMGRNMTAISVGDDTILLDIGLHLENYIHLTEDESIKDVTIDMAERSGAIPDITRIASRAKNVRAIIPTHAHLDHLGGVPFLESRFSAPIICTPFTANVLRSIVRDDKVRLKNKIHELNPNSSFQVSPDMSIEFINTTHSTPQTVMVAVHSQAGTLVYANDFKFDRHPTLGKKTDLKHLAKLGKKGVKALIVDSTYSTLEQKMPSESIVKQLLEDVMLGIDIKRKALIVTTFSSHIARLRTICDFARILNRKVVMIGRSLNKYVEAAQAADIADFKDIDIVRYASKARSAFKKIMQNGKDKYVIIVTGHQGEPNSILSKMVQENFGFSFHAGDIVIFSCNVIPTPTNVQNRERIESRLKDFNVRFFKGIHVSGHAAKEDIRELIQILKPEHVIPAHGDETMLHGTAVVCDEEDYDSENVHILKNGSKLVI